MNLFAISALINALVALGFGIFVIACNSKSKVNRLYFLMGLAVAFWSVGYWQWQSSIDADSALFWVRILSIGSLFIPIFYFHWIVALLDIYGKQKRIVWLTYIIAFIFLSFSFSNLFIEGVREKMFFLFWPDPGILYNLYFVLIYLLLISYSIFILFKHYRSSSGEKRAQITYILIGSIIGFGGGLTNFFLWYNIQIPPYGNFLVALYPFFLGYAVIKYRLFDVKMVATESFVFLIWTLLFVNILTSNNFQGLLINIGIFVAVLIIGIFLIRGILKDIKQREQIEKMNKEIIRAYEIEKQANEELKRVDEAKTNFMLVTQHHLRTPLTVTMGFLDLLLNGTYGKIPKKIIEVVKKADEAIIKEIGVVNDLLSVSTFQLGKGFVNLDPVVSTQKILEEIVNDLKPAADNKKIYLKLENADNIPKISADTNQLKMALQNIIDNAIKYTKQGGVTITINPKSQIPNPKQIQNPKPVILITVKDTGIGMDPEDRKDLFEKAFQRSKEAWSANATGKGIGLFLSAQIIKAHGGKIWAESEGRGKGSAFHIELPVIKSIENKK